MRETKTREVIRIGRRNAVRGDRKLGPKLPTAVERKSALGPKLGPAAPTKAERLAMAVKKPTALENQIRKGGESRAIRAANLRETRAYGALKPSTPAKLGRAKVEDRTIYDEMQKRARTASFPANPQVTTGEAAMAQNGQRQYERQELMKFRKQKNLEESDQLAVISDQKRSFETPGSRLLEFGTGRDRGDTARDIAVGGGALASGGAAIYAAKKFGKTSDAVRKHAAYGAREVAKTTRAARGTMAGVDAQVAQTGSAVRGALFGAGEQVEKTARTARNTLRGAGQAAERFTPKEIASTLGAEVSAKTRKTLKGYFPTFIKGGKKVSAFLKKSFETPASRLIEFNNGNQWKREGDQRYGNAWKAAAGMERGYFDKKADGTPNIRDIPLYHAQVIKGTYNKAKKIQRVANRGGSLVKDAADTLVGRPRAKDAAGRTKKKEWEKPWFGNAVKTVAIAGVGIAGAKHLRNNPAHREWVRKQVNKGVRKANSISPDIMKEWETGEGVREFATPASGLFEPLRKGAEKLVRKSAFGNKLMGPTQGARAAVSQREALLGRLQSKVKVGGAGVEKAARVTRRVQKNLAGKKAEVKLGERYQKDAIRSVKRGAAVAGAGALAGGAAMKLHADQPEDRKTYQGARFRNALMGAAAGSFLGGGLAGGKSGFKGARVGAALGGLVGAISNPKRKQAIEDLPTAGFEESDQWAVISDQKREFETPAGRLIEFADGKRFKKVVKNPETGRPKTVHYGQAGKAADGGDRIRPGTSKGDAYCARSAKIGGDWKSDPNSPNNLSRRKWKCSGSVSRKDLATPAGRLIEFAKVPFRGITVKRYAGQKVRPGAARGTWASYVADTWGVPAKGSAEAVEAARKIRIFKKNPIGKEVDSVRKAIAKDPNFDAGRKYANSAVNVRDRYGVESYKKGSRQTKAAINQLNIDRARGKNVTVAKGWDGSPYVETGLSTPASRLIEFDGYAADAGWDIRDPRGKSARVFAPGSRQRVRREKEWYEKSDNERKLWKAGLVAAGIAGLAGGAAIGRRLPKVVKKAAAVVEPAKVVKGPWAKSG